MSGEDLKEIATTLEGLSEAELREVELDMLTTLGFVRRAIQSKSAAHFLRTSRPRWQEN